MPGMESVPILAYHSIDERGTPISIRPDAFRAQLSYLRERGFKSLSLADWLAGFAQERAPDAKSVVITFDDGYRNTALVAAPILLEHGFRAAVFLATDFLGKRSSWPSNVHLGDEAMLDWEQARALAAQGFEIHPHSRSHPLLPTLSDSDLEREIVESRNDVERELGKPAAIFCYPHGKFDERALAVLRRNGFQGAVTTRFGFNGRDEDPFQLRRIGSAWFRRHPRAFRWFVRGPRSCAFATRAGTLWRRLRGRGTRSSP